MERTVSSPGFEPFLLSNQVQHSNNDVKCLFFGKPSETSADCPKLLSASRDKSAKSFMIGSETFTREDSVDPANTPSTEIEVDSLVELYQMQGHNDFLQCVAEDPSGQIVVTGSNDKTIRVWAANTGSLAAVLCGHDQAAKCFVFMQDSSDRTLLVSGGWDKKCCVWDIFGSRRLIMDLYLHEQPVLCLCTLPVKVNNNNTSSYDLILSGSGDKRIVLWDPSNRGKPLMEFCGHTDTVQSVAAIDSERFVSAGNDGDILVWDVPADAYRHIQMKKVTAPTYRVAAHEAFVYSIAYDPSSKLLFSGSEDKTLKIWSGVDTCGRSPSNQAPPKNEQVVLQPSIVWTICVFKGEQYSASSGQKGTHVAVAGGDGFIRVWSNNRTRIASPEVMDAFDAAVTANGGSGSGKAQGDNNDQPYGDPATLPTADQLPAPERDGQRAFVRGTAGEVELYTSANGQWERIGTVVQNPNNQDAAEQNVGAGTGGSREPPPPRKKQFYKGKAWDYLFPVQVGSQNLVLPYNAGDNIFDAAQMFIYDNGHLGVSDNDKKEIEQHIISQLHPHDRDLLTAQAQSGFAREQQQQRNTQGGAAASSSSGTPAVPTTLAPSLFTTNPNVQTVGTKLQEYGCSPAGVVSLLEQLIAAPSTDNDTGALLLTSAKSLNLSECHRLPYFDIIRLVACKAPTAIDHEAFNHCVDGAVSPFDNSTGSPETQKARDIERVMSMRAMANMAHFCSSKVNIFASNSNNNSEGLIVSIRKVFLIPSASPLMKAAALAFFVNCALKLSSPSSADLSDDEMESISALLQAVGAWLTVENDDNNTRTLVLIAAQLITESRCKNDVVRAIAASGSADVLGPEVERLSGASNKRGLEGVLEELKSALQ